MFLIRIAFWLIIVIMLLPTNRAQQSQMLGSAEATVKDLSGFCTRNPHVCADGQDAFHVFMQKAQFGANMLAGFVRQQAQAEEERVADRSDSTGNHPTAGQTQNTAYAPPAPQNRAYQTKSENTLTPSDLVPAWRAPHGT